ncbi:MAG: DUF1080 domain-containing protein [Verrucomicrobiales bacterium]|nr:DUF1080 domain-containing protein [Verrucomicrobiales bacterium]
MKFFLFCSLLLPFSLLLADKSVALTHPAADDSSFTVVYDGKDLSQIETEGNWQIQKDGSLHLTPREGEKGWKRYGSYIWLKGDYADFVVDFEFNFAEGGNSGLYFRCADTIDPTVSGFEIQILDSHGEEKELGHHDMGGVIRTCGPITNAAKPAGEWQRMTVSMKGDRLAVVLNGILVQDINLREKKPKDKELAESGKICIQDHGLPFTVRNIQVKKL